LSANVEIIFNTKADFGQDFLNIIKPPES